MFFISWLTEGDTPQKFLRSREIVQLLECRGNGIVWPSHSFLALEKEKKLETGVKNVVLGMNQLFSAELFAEKKCVDERKIKYFW